MNDHDDDEQQGEPLEVRTYHIPLDAIRGLLGGAMDDAPRTVEDYDARIEVRKGELIAFAHITELLVARLDGREPSDITRFYLESAEASNAGDWPRVREAADRLFLHPTNMRQLRPLVSPKPVLIVAGALVIDIVLFIVWPLIIAN